MVDDTAPKIRTIIILLIGALGMLLLSYGCVIDWINKIKLGNDWLVNLFYHPITGVIGIIFFTLFVLFILEKASSGRLKSIRDYLDGKKQLVMANLVITIVTLLLLIISSYLLLIAGTSGVGVLVAFHTLMGIVFGICLMISMLKSFISRYLDDPSKWQNYILVVVIVALIVSLVIVIIGREVGLITLSLA